MILASIGVVTNLFLSDFLQKYVLMSNVKALLRSELELRQTEKNFLIEETINPDFYVTGNSEYVDQFNFLFMEVRNTLDYLKTSRLVNRLDLNMHLREIERNFEEYNSNFHDFVKLIMEKGFKDFGVIGEMRNQIHFVEEVVNAKQDLFLNQMMLTLRRHEKDYLLRKDLKYREKFRHEKDKFVKTLVNPPYDQWKESETLVDALHKYQDLFNMVIDYDTQIGLTTNRGILGRLSLNIRKIDKYGGEIHDAVYKNFKEEISKSKAGLFIVTFLLSGLIMLVIYRISRRIIHSLKHLRAYILRLGRGELPDQIEIKTRDEVGEMIESINILVQNLNNTRDFAIEVGNGNLETDINVFNNEGELGSKLVEMREKLLELSKQQEKQKLDEKRRSWANEGMAIIADILRKDHADMRELGFVVLKTLVNYIDAVQGALYITDEKDNAKMLELVATYAYNRRKFREDKIAFGQGLVGSCAVEKEAIYMTEIPGDYLTITSGLGDASPDCLLIVPLNIEEEVLGILEIAGFKEIEAYKRDFIEKACTSIASSIQSVKISQRTNELLRQHQEQAEELAQKEEEMRQNMEELTATQESMSRREAELINEIQSLKNKHQREIKQLRDYINDSEPPVQKREVEELD